MMTDHPSSAPTPDDQNPDTAARIVAPMAPIRLTSGIRVDLDFAHLERSALFDLVGQPAGTRAVLGVGDVSWPPVAMLHLLVDAMVEHGLVLHLEGSDHARRQWHGLLAAMVRERTGRTDLRDAGERCPDCSSETKVIDHGAALILHAHTCPSWRIYAEQTLALVFPGNGYLIRRRDGGSDGHSGFAGDAA